MNGIDKLATLIEQDRDDLFARWRQQVWQVPDARQLATPTLIDLNPMLLDELAAALRLHLRQTIPEVLRSGSSPAQGFQRFQDGFDIEEVVAE